MTKVVEDDKARQAPPGRPVLYVLIASLALVGVYLITMVGWSGTTSPPSEQPATTGSTSSSNTSGVPAGNPAYPVPAAPSANPQGEAAPQGGANPQ
ncbi:hypothetical protein [Enterovirga rhinocerotis]|uniref:Uncharacterized protein n=1 Tax=Enterovirga rhinocerotis TaxID=1339210 RepID=A0A4R7CA49_9HYPH|nr:hypothetical protein [Enterovirga rhinocerotis]TDR93667.1 hypothetical protein EV668_0932 [Enterovirga rhinocerotis]